MEKPKTYLDSNANELTESVDKNVAQLAAYQLLNIFPEEIWLEILARLTSSSDLENVSNASLFFRQLLSQRATLFLFPNVFKILASSRMDTSSNFSFTGSCRLVCSAWNQDIQTLHESHNAPNHEHLGNLRNFTFPRSSSSGINEFIEHFGKTHYAGPFPSENPFLGRTVIFDDTKFLPGLNTDGLDYLTRFWSDISNLLMKYGSHIWHCTIHLEDKFPSRQDYYFKLCEWMDLMTNLKSLKVNYYHNSKHKIDSIYRLERDIMDYAFPKLKQLESLELSNVPVPISNEIIRRNNRICRLMVNGVVRNV